MILVDLVCVLYGSLHVFLKLFLFFFDHLLVGYLFFSLLLLLLLLDDQHLLVVLLSALLQLLGELDQDFGWLVLKLVVWVVEELENSFFVV